MTTERDHFNELKEGIFALSKRAKDLETYNASKISLNPKGPICTKCVRNLFYYDGWHCKCEKEDLNLDNWVNFETVDDRVKNLKEENQKLRKVISQIANNLGNGSAVSEEASIEFIEELPKEVELVRKEWTRKANNTKIIENMLGEIKEML